MKDELNSADAPTALTNENPSIYDQLKSGSTKRASEDVQSKSNLEEVREKLLPPTHPEDMKRRVEDLGGIETVEELYSVLGNPGLFAKVVFAVACFNMLSIATNHAAGVFMDYSPDHVCHVMDKNATVLSSDQMESTGNTSSSSSSSLTPIDASRVIYSECDNTYVSEGPDEKNVTRRCGRGQWKYGVEERESSSVTEWDLVCDRSSMAHLSSTLYFCGVMAGGLLFGLLSDALGRRRAVLLSLYALTGLGVGIVLTHNLMVYIVLRTLMGVASQGFLTSTYIRVLELFGPRYRGFAGNGMYCVWGIALNYLGLMAWVLKGWRLVQLACIAQALAGIFYMWMLPESLRWLVAKGKTKEATKLTARICRMNGCSDTRCLDADLMVRLTGGKTTGKAVPRRSSVFDLFRQSSLLRRTAILSYVTFAVNIGYWGLTYNTQALVGNRYQNFVLSTIPEIFVYIINIFVLSRFGRKRPMMFYFFVTSLCSLISCFLSSTSALSSATNMIVMVVSTVGRLMACGLMGTNDVFMAELYPTLVRNSGVGVCVGVGRMGAVITPIIFSLTQFTFQGLPLLSFGVVTLIAVFMTMLLPDTWKRDLPETLHDLEMTVEVTAAPAQGKESLLLPSDNLPVDDKNADMTRQL